MDKTKLKVLTTEDLKKKEKAHKTLIGIFIPLVIALIFFLVRDYTRGEELDWTTITITICTIGGAVSIFPELKAVQEELESRR